MSWDEDQQHAAAPASGIFAVRGDLDGADETNFQDREQFIGLRVGGEDFLLQITAVREIIMLVPITFVPNGPEAVDGVINLRGTILAAVNARKLMGMPRGEPDDAAARIIIARDGDVTFALIVDGITNVVALLPSEVENQALPGKGGGAELIGSMSKHGSKVVGILDPARILKQVCPADKDEVEGVEADAA